MQGSSGYEEASPNSAAASGKSPTTEQKKTCADCGTSKTPLWRGGPAGPKVTQPPSFHLLILIHLWQQIRSLHGMPWSDICYFLIWYLQSLCNACWIRSRKKKRAILGISKGSGDDARKGKRSSSSNNKLGDSLNLKQRLMALGRQVLMQRSTHTHRNKLGEEEQAAVLLMSLSYGSVYAWAPFLIIKLINY